MARALPLLLLAACGPSAPDPGACPFHYRCNGNVLETCVRSLDGGQPTILDLDCGTRNASCVAQVHQVATCVAACDSTFVPYCEGPLLVDCDFSSGTGLVGATDCDALYSNSCDPLYGCGIGGTCVDYGGGQVECQPY